MSLDKMQLCIKWKSMLPAQRSTMLNCYKNPNQFKRDALVQIDLKYSTFKRKYKLTYITS